jgi:hypothetical protein
MDKSHEAAMFSAALSDYVQPAFGGVKRIGRSGGIEQTIGPGIVLLGLAVLGWFTTWKTNRNWAWIALCFIILSLGPALDIGLTLDRFLLLGFPGMGFSLPWQTEGMRSVCEHAVTDPWNALSSNIAISLPYSWLPKVFPLLAPFRVPARFGVMVLYCVAIVGAVGLSQIWDYVRAKSNAAAACAVAAILFGVILFEYCSTGEYPHSTPIRYPFFEQLGKDPANYAIIEFPVIGNELSSYGQVFHHKALFKAFLSRTPTEAMYLLDHNSILGGNSASDHTINQALKSRQDMKQLYDLGARYIVTGGDADATIPTICTATRVYSGPDMGGYRIDSPAPGPLTIAKGQPAKFEARLPFPGVPPLQAKAQ